jgi:hypothetical protein
VRLISRKFPSVFPRVLFIQRLAPPCAVGLSMENCSGIYRVQMDIYRRSANYDGTIQHKAISPSPRLPTPHS